MEPNRRKFIKSSALVAGATALPIIGSAQVVGSGTLKVALVGCGGRGTQAVQQILASPGIQVVAMADAFAPSIAKCLNTLNNAKKGEGSSVNVPAEHQFTGLDAYKKATDLADIVMLCTPPGFRPKHFAYAVEKGKHVFMEKPVATTADGVRIVLEAAKKAKPETKIVVGFQRRFEPIYIETLKRIQDGMMGDIIGAQVHWMGGGLWVRDRQPGDTEFQYQCRNWFYFDYIGGDGIVEQHIHNIDVANWFLGTLPERAYGTGGRSVRIGPQFGNIYDHFATEFTHPKGVVVNSFWRHHDGAQSRVGELFLGSKGRAQAGTIWDRDGNVLWKYEGPRSNGQQIEQDELVAHIRADKPINMAEAAANSTMTALLGRQTCYGGNSIPWARGLAAKDKMVPDADDFSAEVPAKPGEGGLYATAIPGKYNPLDPFA